MLEAGTLQPRPQDHRLATAAPRLSREDGRIHWDADARTIVSLIRGLSPSPSAYTLLDGKQLKIFTATAETAAVRQTRRERWPGRPPSASASRPGDGYVVLREVQLEGKKRLAVRDFLRGVRIAPGQVLG